MQYFHLYLNHDFGYKYKYNGKINEIASPCLLLMKIVANQQNTFIKSPNRNS